MDAIAAPGQFDRVPSGAAAGIEDPRTRQDAALHEPVRDHRALFPNGTIDEKVERPRILGIERTTCGLVHHVGVRRLAPPFSVSVPSSSKERFSNAPMIVVAI